MEIMSKAESNFLKVIVRPLWSLMNNFLTGELSEGIKFLDDNIIEWEKITNGPGSLERRKSSMFLRTQSPPLEKETKPSEMLVENKEIKRPELKLQIIKIEEIKNILINDQKLKDQVLEDDDDDDEGEESKVERKDQKLLDQKFKEMKEFNHHLEKKKPYEYILSNVKYDISANLSPAKFDSFENNNKNESSPNSPPPNEFSILLSQTKKRKSSKKVDFVKMEMDSDK